MIGLHIMRPTSIVVAGAGSSASIRADGGVDFTSATSLSLNGVFTAGYDNYMMVCRHIGSGSADSLNIRLRLSGTDADAANYTFQRLLADGTTVNGARDSSQTVARLSSTDTAQRYGFTAYIYGPNLAQPTAFRSVTVEGFNNGRFLDYAATHSLSTAYDGISIRIGSIAFTGMVTVYGMAQ